MNQILFLVSAFVLLSAKVSNATGILDGTGITRTAGGLSAEYYSPTPATDIASADAEMNKCENSLKLAEIELSKKGFVILSTNACSKIANVNYSTGATTSWSISGWISYTR